MINAVIRIIKPIPDGRRILKIDDFDGDSEIIKFILFY
jgi:hypothetical protein